MAEDKPKLKVFLEFETWLLNFLVFIGGGIGMLATLLLHFQYPAGYNGMWWAFCYTSIQLWGTLYLYICNPLRVEIGNIVWLSAKHLSWVAYVLLINLIGAVYIWKIRKKKFDEYDVRHTGVFLIGALGGTIGSIVAIFASRRGNGETYYYVSVGFFIMLISQIIFTQYMMMAGFF